jgi:Fe-S cluster biogenesis protein NfuA/nitrite reductase/ring-hydroxylating ferredoxin subunit
MRMKEGTVPASTAGSAPSTSVPSAPAAEPDAERVLDLRAVGDRIETLLEASSSGGTVARERSEELVRLLSELYGAGLLRMMEILDEQQVLTGPVLDALAGDDLVASLLLIHDLHPEDVSTRVERALDSVRPYLGSHGGDVELLGITDEGVVRLRLLGSCDGCSSSAATMSLAIEDAISQAAPEVTGFDVQSPAARPSAPPGRGLIPLAVVPHGSPHPATDEPPVSAGWMAVPGLDNLAAGEVLDLTVGGLPIIVCRVGADLLAFRDGCADCGAGLAAARLERRLGSATGGGVLTCPACRTHYDVRLAGAAIDGAGAHLDPLPLLARHGRTEVAIPQSASESLFRAGSR